MKKITILLIIILGPQVFGSLDCNNSPVQKDLTVKTKCVRNKVTYSLMYSRSSTAAEYCLLTENNGSKKYSKESAKEEMLHSGYLYKFNDVEFFIEFEGRGARPFLFANKEFTPCKL